MHEGQIEGMYEGIGRPCHCAHPAIGIITFGEPWSSTRGLLTVALVLGEQCDLVAGF